MVNPGDSAARTTAPAPTTPLLGASRLAFADGLRGLAALWVVLYHASEGGHLTQLKAVLPKLITDLVFNFGHLGVPVFFVLSGFVMAFTVQSETVDRAFAGRFVLRRLVRRQRRPRQLLRAAARLLGRQGRRQRRTLVQQGL